MKIGSMRIGIVTMPKPLPSGPSTAERIGHIAREVERLGFAGLWTTDAPEPMTPNFCSAISGSVEPRMPW